VDRERSMPLGTVHDSSVDLLANLATFLGSDLSCGITGETIFVDGGYSALAMAELPVSRDVDQTGIWDRPKLAVG
jgi:enoyl-[acyl-carrier-protein] reductase (NADH)